MVVDFRVRNPILRIGICLATIFAFGFMLMAGLNQFVVGTLADRRLGYQDWAVEGETEGSLNSITLADGLARYPDSSRLQFRLAEAEIFENGQDAELERHAAEAIRLSPYDYKQRELLAYIEESHGDRASAEQTLRTAISLAPNYVDVHWRLANLLIREGKLEDAAAEFIKAGRADNQFLPNTLDLLWRASKGDISKLRPLVEGDPARLDFAQFLLKRQRPEEAVDVFDEVDRGTRLASKRTAEILNSLITDGHYDLAKKAWMDLVGGASETGPADSVMWNGGFESDILLNLTQFDWSIAPSDYARISIDTGIAHTGKRSLRVDFSGRDTTKLDSEIKQLVVVKPGTQYRLQWYVKTDHLATSKGPQIEIEPVSSASGVLSEPIVAGSSDWHQGSLDFSAPSANKGSAAVYLKIVRKPDFSYDDPTQGSVWFDDFSLVELKKTR